MPIWKKVDQAADAPKYKLNNSVGANGSAMYANTTPGAFTDKSTEGVFGVSTAEVKASGKLVAPGWTLIKHGTGPVVNVSSTGGTSYANGDIVRVSGGQTNATYTVTTNSTGGPSSFTSTNQGKGFSNTSSLTVAVTNSTGGATTGSGATISVTLGGRAGRRLTEVLAVVRVTGDGSDDTTLPDA